MKFKINPSEEKTIEFGEMDNKLFLIGLLNEFVNRFQAEGDNFLGDITWKQCFTLNCISLFETPPSLRELSDFVGSSHQNVKQILIKLEKMGYVEFVPDEKDKRKQRIHATKEAQKFIRENDKERARFMQELFKTVDANELRTTVNTLLKLDEQLKVWGKSPLRIILTDKES
jgi:DNA-binding MarR family transcriptional regulator